MTIKEYRMKRGLTQSALARELSTLFKGVDVSLISKFENGVCQPNAELQAYIDREDWGLRAELTPSQERIYNILKTSEAPVTRTSLCFFCQQDDRSNRMDIADMRKKGIRICSSSRGKGYWIAKSEDEYEAMRREYLARIADMASTVKAMDNYVEGQVRIGG